MRRRLPLLLVLGALPGCAGDVALPDDAPLRGRVTRVVDGDTIKVRALERTRRKRYTVRLIGIDTPEVDWYGGDAECFGEQAGRFARTLIRGQRVRLEFDEERRDRYGRLLAYVYRDSLFVNAEMVRRGYATVATFPPNVAHADQFRRLAERARMSGRGLWSRCVGAG